MTEVAVTDTHALVWYALERWGKLGRRARELYRRADAGKALIYVPAVVCVELSEVVWSGRIRLDPGFTQWCRALLSSGHFLAADLTLEIVLCADGLYAVPERGDRLIAATAMHLGLPLITRDPRIAEAAGVDVVW
jgi:PIN domain nuclease of toxin-antitoxin system